MTAGLHSALLFNHIDHDRLLEKASSGGIQATPNKSFGVAAVVYAVERIPKTRRLRGCVRNGIKLFAS
jgi:hypothetical protein